MNDIKREVEFIEELNYIEYLLDLWASKGLLELEEYFGRDYKSLEKFRTTLAILITKRMDSVSSQVMDNRVSHQE